MEKLPLGDVEYEAESGRLSRRIAFAILLWLSFIVALYSWQSSHLQNDTVEMAVQEAITHFNKDQALRLWATSHGGVYVATDENTPPSPWLSHIPERDITTPSGKQLTLMNPAYILRQVTEEHTRLFGTRGHLTSLKLLNPGNNPDRWERDALEAFEAGAREVTEMTEIDGKPYYRFMRPMITQRGCLKCHKDQGYRVGDIRGGVSVAIDMAPYLKHQQEEQQNQRFALFTIFVIGLSGLLIGWYRGVKQIRERGRSHQELQESNDKFHSVTDAAQDAIVAIDDAGAIHYWNRAAERIFRYSREEAMGKNLHRLIVPEHYHQAHIDGWQYFAKTGEGAVIGKTIEVSAQDRDGQEFPVELSISTIKTQGGWQAVGVIRDIRERKQAEEQLSEINKKIEQAHREWMDAFDSIQDPIFLHDADGMVMRANLAYAERAGMVIDDVIGRPYWECFPRGDGPMQSCARAQGPDDADGIDEEFTLESGEIFLSRAFAICDDDGNYRYSIHIMEDITLERQAAHSLKESEDRFRKLFEKAPLAYQSLDREGCLIEVNQKWEEIFGYPYNEVIGQPFSNFLTSQYSEQFQEILDNIHKKQDIHAIELEICSKSGTVRLVSLEGRVSYDSHSGIERSHFILGDITERREMLNDLRESEEKFRRIFDGTLDGILLADVENKKFFMANHKICLMLGYSFEELEHMGVTDIHPKEDLPYVIDQFEKQRQGEIELAENIPVKRKDGSIFYADISASSITLNNIHYQIGIFRDISERKIAEDSQLALNQLLQTSKACNEALVRATEESALTRQICNILADHADFSLVWVGLSDATLESKNTVYCSDNCESIDLFNSNWDDEEGPGPAREAIRTGKIQVIHASDDDPTFQAYREKMASLDCFSLAALPLQNKNKSLGVMMVYSYKDNVFNQQQIDLLEELSNDLAYGISSLRTHIERDHMGQRLERNLLQTVQAIARTLETRDPYTAGHQRRVTELSIAIAEELGLDEQQIEGIRFGATIHDIGKIHIPAEILNYPGQLSEMEFGIIKTHTEVGNNIVKDIDFPWPVADIIYQHHERLDGSGYPQGLKGDEIILEARILAVADVVEAISSHRPYRPSMGIEAALDELRKNRGKFYDPEITDICIKLFEDNRFTFSDSF